jgi:hypothetical protein
MKKKAAMVSGMYSGTRAIRPRVRVSLSVRLSDMAGVSPLRFCGDGLGQEPR